ncbi:MAG: hypothetical protein BGN88_14715 [Clostridiales bacterium 43-6]|nr:MAG: hypothetical protein BGN88_14715 [Clostridiales bacterium 43-6]
MGNFFKSFQPFKKKKKCCKKRCSNSLGCLDLLMFLVLIAGVAVLVGMVLVSLFKVLGLVIVVGCIIGFLVLLITCK